MNPVSNTIDLFFSENTYPANEGDAPAALAKKMILSDKAPVVDSVAEQAARASMAVMSLSERATGMAVPSASVVLLSRPSVEVTARQAGQAVSSVLVAFSDNAELPKDIQKFKRMGVMELITMMKIVNRDGAEKMAAQMLESIDLQLEKSLEANLKKAEVDIEMLDKRAEQKDESLKGKIVKWVAPAITTVTAVVNVAIGVLKVLTGNLTGVSDIAAGIMDLTSAALRIALIFNPANQDMQKAAMILESTAMAVGLIGGVAGGLKYLGAKATTAILKKLTVQALETGGQKLLLKAAVESGQQATSQIAKNMAIDIVKKVADDVATTAADAFKKELSDQLQIVIARGVKRQARMPSGQWQRVAQRLLNAPSVLVDAVLEKAVQLSLKNLDPALIKKIVSDQLQEVCGGLMKRGGKKGAELEEAILKGVNPQLRQATVNLLSAAELMLTTTTHVTTMVRTNLDQQRADIMNTLAMLDIRQSELEHIIEMCQRRIKKGHQMVGMSFQKMGRADTQYATQSQQFNDMMMQVASSRA